MIEYLCLLLLVNGEIMSSAMGRGLLDSSSNVTQPPVTNPVSLQQSKHNRVLVVVIVVLMVLVTCAICSCCFIWERQLRLRIEATRSSTRSLQGPVGSNHSSGPQMGSSPSVIVLLGDGFSRSVAWGVPRRISSSVASETALEPTPANADQSLRKLAPT